MDVLAATVQPYAWGDPSFIAELQGRAPSGDPEAELWMGAHPKAPSRLESTGRPLNEAIAAAPGTLLGPAATFGQLPFLAKVLAAAEPLSIQTHPDLDRARAGFARENAAGVALDSPTRTYRDANHKPELICALTPFDAKCGFRDLHATRDLVDGLADTAVDPLRERLAADGAPGDVLADVLGWLLTLEPDEASSLTSAVVAACAEITDGPWAAPCGWSPQINALYPGDPGVVVALLLNHLTLEPGQAVFLEAGVLHAYLRGAGIEVMANSDNVIRGGLTPKHVDVAELAEVVDATPIDPPIQSPLGPVHTYDSPVPEFDLTRIVTDDEYNARVDGPEIVIATKGRFRLTCGDRTVDVESGQPVWISADDGNWHATGTGTLFRTTVPVDQA